MELKDYSTKELKEELKRRAELSREQKAEELKNAKRCRNCRHCMLERKSWYVSHKCLARTWGKKRPRNYTVTPSQKACDLFEKNEE